MAKKDKKPKKDERRKKNGVIYNLDDIRRHKEKLKKQKEKGPTFIEEKEDYPQEVLELIEAENESRRMSAVDIEIEIANADKALEDYATLPLVEDDE